jgi:serine phosphatase RsbU (regulator of sigma subunit)
VNGRIDLASVARALQAADPTDIPDVVSSAAGELGGTDVVVYLVDFDQQTLHPLPDRGAHDEVPCSEAVGGSIAGRVYQQRRSASAERSGGIRIWVPIMEGSDPTGVLALTVPADGDEIVSGCEELGVLVGYLIATEARVTDLYNLRRRRQALSLAASMQWDLLPPLALAARGVTAAGMLEPAYEVGGDCFDYALNGPVLDLALMDAMGHGVQSAMMAALAIGCYRHQRREGRPLEQLHDDLDRVIAQHCGGAFVSGIVGRLDLITGAFTFLNAGHPPPLLIRHGQVIGSIESVVTPAWGFRLGEPRTSTVALEPGDSVLLYTDGVIDARGSPHDDFGSERLADLAGQHASDQLPVGVTVRLLTRAVLEHHHGHLHDDATVFMFRWAGSSNRPGPPRRDN